MFKSFKTFITTMGILIILSVIGGIYIPQKYITSELLVYQILCTLSFLFIFIFTIAYLFRKEFNMTSNFLDEIKRNQVLNRKLVKNNLIKDVMLEVSNSIIRITDSEELLKLLLNKIINVIDDAHKGSVLVLKDNNFLEYKAAVGYDLDKLRNINLRLDETFLWKVSGGNISKPCIIRDIRAFNIDKSCYTSLIKADALDMETTLSSPIIIDNKLFGMINIDSKNSDAFNQEDLLLMEYFSNQASIAIKNHQLLEKTIVLSRYDGLTNVYNRCYFDELLNKAYKKAIRYDETFCLVLFDLDKLKFINDNYGHAAGDKVIKYFATIVKDNIRDTDLFARYGGDEFVGAFFYMDKGDIDETIKRINEILISNPLSFKGEKFSISFSYGIACFPEESRNLDSLFQIADKRMYLDKKAKE